ncbi:MAG TPA: helix-turn-helix domain-containing protein, partial [Candidatus Faecisoma merdavium]|nr:helix-turn-helix domain-containing protein [Candidatus Faecisoma merdavium]
MKIYKAYKFRLYPNKIQQELINKTLGSTRFIYNTMLYEKEKLYKENKMT